MQGQTKVSKQSHLFHPKINETNQMCATHVASTLPSTRVRETSSRRDTGSVAGKGIAFAVLKCGTFDHVIDFWARVATVVSPEPPPRWSVCICDRHLR